MERADAAFLAEVRGFLDAAEADDTQASAIEDDKLLLASHQLLAETQELLASCTATTENQENTTNYSSELKNQVSPKSRRDTRNAQAAKRRFRHRQKLKDEKETLIQQERDLAIKLITLQGAATERKRREAGNLMLGAWRAIATRQLERRLQVEHEQKQLRAEVVGRSRLIRQMNEMLQLSQSESLISYETMETSGEGDSAALFKTMLSDAERLYTQTDKIFSSLEFKLSVSISYDLIRKWSQGVMFFDSADMMAFPYEFEQAVDAVSAVLMADPETNLDSIKGKDSKDTVTVKYNVKYQLSRENSANFVIYGAARRYREKDRLIIVWRSLTEGQGEFEGLQCDETTWLVLHPSSSCSSGQSSTVLKTYSRLVPVELANASRSHENVDRFVKTLAKSGEEEFKEMREMMEKLIVCDQ